MQTCQMCGTAIAGDEVLYTADARIVCAGCFGKADVAATASRSSGAVGLYAAGAITALIPFNFHVSESSSVMVNGQVVEATSRDYIALICGVIAMMLGAIGTVRAIRSKARGAAIAGWFVIIALGAYQIARGLGAL